VGHAEVERFDRGPPGEDRAAARVEALPAERIAYASLPDRLMVRDAPDPAIRLVIVTSGTGASTAFAIAEETIAELFGAAA
jgi:hypothetical protein